MADKLDYFAGVLRPKIKDLFHLEATGHDIQHLERVYNLALHLQEKEGGDRLVIGVAALLHDIHRLMKRPDGKLTMPVESLPQIESILLGIDFPKDLLPKVLRAIELHEDYSFGVQNQSAQDIETKILQDADRLEAIGAIGVARCFAFGGAHGKPIFDPSFPLTGSQYDSSEAKDPSQIHHFYSKLLKLGSDMHTKTGKAIAKKRHAFMKTFVDQFLDEWSGVK